jgi:hypothetical protein
VVSWPDMERQGGGWESSMLRQLCSVAETDNGIDGAVVLFVIIGVSLRAGSSRWLAS